MHPAGPLPRRRCGGPHAAGVVVAAEQPLLAAIDFDQLLVPMRRHQLKREEGKDGFVTFRRCGLQLRGQGIRALPCSCVYP